MFIKILPVFLLTIIFDYQVETAPVVTQNLQFLPPIPGYIPVYIRNGNTPLEEINQQLAEAFRSYAVKNARLNSIRARSQNVLTDDYKGKSNEDVNKLEKSPGNKSSKESEQIFNEENTTAQHIQKIKPRN